MRTLIHITLVCLALIVGPAGLARADTFTWSYSGLLWSIDGEPVVAEVEAGGGTLTTGGVADGLLGSGFRITDITGTWIDLNIKGLVPLGAAYNILYFPSTPHLDLFGMAFTLGDGAEHVELNATSIYAANRTICPDCLSTEYLSFGVFTVTPSAVPLPAALPLFAGGLGLMAWWARRRKRSLVAAA